MDFDSSYEPRNTRDKAAFLTFEFPTIIDTNEAVEQILEVGSIRER